MRPFFFSEKALTTLTFAQYNDGGKLYRGAMRWYFPSASESGAQVEKKERVAEGFHHAR